ncbi:MAG: hypothetical protein JXA93_04370 [Anaerolineae bacterium]|nr:hypothetical protein [Anaerolineae bacterium]
MLVRERSVQLLLVAVLLATPMLSSAAASPRVPLDTAPSAVMQPPERLSTADPFDVAFGAGYVFWTNLAGEFCSPPGRVRSVNLTTRVETTLLSDCESGPAIVVADDTHVYWTDWGSDEVRRLPAGGGTPTTVAAGRNLIYHRALVVDDTYVYFGDDDGIQRAPKAGGAVVTLAAGYNSTMLAVDDTHVYWTEWSLVDPDAIRRVPKAGGTVDTILSGGTLGDPRGIAVDASYVYWTEQDGGMVRRVAKTGGTILDLAPAELDYLGGSIAVNDTDVYWTDTTGTSTGRLRRVAKGGGSVEDLALGLWGPGGVNLSATHVYWGDGDGIWRLPLDAGAVAVDLTIDALEITQGIQNLANGVPLVQDKTTFVRAYPAVDIADTANVTAVLHGSRGGADLPGSPISAVDPNIFVHMSGYNRGVLSQSFNFWLPPSWRSGTVTLRAEINPGGIIPETDVDNNSFSLTRTFNHKDPLCVDMVRVRTSPTTASISDAGFWEIVEFLEAIYPVPEILIYEGGMIEEIETCWWGPFPYPCGGPYEVPDDGSWVLSRLWWYNLWTDDPSECNNDSHYYGMVHPSETSWYGLGYRPGDEAMGVMHVDPAILGGTAPDWFIPAGGHILSHELGHNRGRRHVDCPPGGPDNIDPGYPYNTCDIAPNSPEGYYGFYLPEQAIIPPTSAADLMTYSHWDDKPQWISDYTYRAIYNDLPSAQADTSIELSPLALEVTSAQWALAVSGVVTPTEGTAMIEPAYWLGFGLVKAEKLARLASRIEVAPDQEYTLKLLDAGEATLYSLPFELPDPGDPVDDTRPFNLVLPFHPDTAYIVLAEGSTELARREVSPSPPEVEVVSPNGGESFAGEMTITWLADDPDGDDLLFTVQYSPDAGATWQPLATNYYSTTLVLPDLGFIPGSDAALVRVIATDGVNTGTDTSDGTFEVAGHPPDVHITLPIDASVHPTGTQILLVGHAIDAEDGTIPGEALEWFLDGTSLGTGKEQAVRGLDVGQYTVTLVATDSDDNTTEDQITLYVGVHRVFLPIVARRH